MDLQGPVGIFSRGRGILGHGSIWGYYTPVGRECFHRGGIDSWNVSEALS